MSRNEMNTGIYITPLITAILLLREASEDCIIFNNGHEYRVSYKQYLKTYILLIDMTLIGLLFLFG